MGTQNCNFKLISWFISAFSKEAVEIYSLIALESPHITPWKSCHLCIHIPWLKLLNLLEWSSPRGPFDPTRFPLAGKCPAHETVILLYPETGCCPSITQLGIEQTPSNSCNATYIPPPSVWVPTRHPRVQGRSKPFQSCMDSVGIDFSQALFVFLDYLKGWMWM